MSIEELRQGLLEHDVTATHVLDMRNALENTLPILFSLAPTNDIESDLLLHCHTKAASSALETLQYLANHYDEGKVAADYLLQDAQGAIARIAELCLVLHETDPPSLKTPPPPPSLTPEKRQETLESIVSTYVGYQRRVIRQRCKPSIKQLVARRKLLQQASSWLHRAEEEEDDDNAHEDGNGTDLGERKEAKATHSHVLTTILGQASALIHPLHMWQASLPPKFVHLHALCTQSIATVDEQAQSMAQTIAGWYMEDHEVDSRWMAQSAAADSGGTHDPQSEELSDLDAIVDELAFGCQVMDRYLALLGRGGREGNPGGKGSNKRTPIQELHPEWTWKYASLERYLTGQQLQSALRLAQPVQIVLGTPIQVPSMVEDAQFLSTRALERAASARSSQAIGTVAHAIASSIWSTDVEGGIYQALLNQRGCYQSANQTPPQTSEASSSAPTGAATTNSGGGSFASNLLGALDDDLATAPITPPRGAATTTARAPSSGNFLGLGSLASSLTGGNSGTPNNINNTGGGGAGRGPTSAAGRLSTYLCAMNGMHSAAASCTSLVHVLDSLLPERSPSGDGEEEDPEHFRVTASSNTSMIELAREELFRFAHSYESFIQDQVKMVVTEYCGSVQDAPVFRGSQCLPVLKYYLERDHYELANADDLLKAEDEARLSQQILDPLRQSILLQKLDQCDGEVLVAICGELAGRLVEVIFQCLISTMLPKRFTDWGSLLLSKQVRIIRDHLSQRMEEASAETGNKTIPMLPQWERLSQVVTVLQLEKPSDWQFYAATSTLTPDELSQILSLKVGFSQEAIASVVASAKKK